MIRDKAMTLPLFLVKIFAMLKRKKSTATAEEEETATTALLTAAAKEKDAATSPLLPIEEEEDKDANEEMKAKLLAHLKSLCKRDEKLTKEEKKATLLALLKRLEAQRKVLAKEEKKATLLALLKRLEAQRKVLANEEDAADDDTNTDTDAEAEADDEDEAESDDESDDESYDEAKAEAKSAQKAKIKESALKKAEEVTVKDFLKHIGGNSKLWRKSKVWKVLNQLYPGATRLTGDSLGNFQEELSADTISVPQWGITKLFYRTTVIVNGKIFSAKVLDKEDKIIERVTFTASMRFTIDDDFEVKGVQYFGKSVVIRNTGSSPYHQSGQTAQSTVINSNFADAEEEDPVASAYETMQKDIEGSGDLSNKLFTDKMRSDFMKPSSKARTELDEIFGYDVACVKDVSNPNMDTQKDITLSGNRFSNTIEGQSCASLIVAVSNGREMHIGYAKFECNVHSTFGTDMKTREIKLSSKKVHPVDEEQFHALCKHGVIDGRYWTFNGSAPH